MTHGTAGNRLCPEKEQAEPGPPCLVSSTGAGFPPDGVWGAGGEEQLGVRGARLCGAAREKKKVSPLGI